MRLRIAIVPILSLILACGGSDTPPREVAVAGAPAKVGSGAGDLVSAEAIARCAGFTVDDAASILGVAAADVEDRSRNETETIRICTYTLASDLYTSVAFSLSPRESVEEAISGMESEREMMGAAQASIDGVSGGSSGDGGFEEIEDVGDEAFRSPLNEALAMRVGNVFVQVTMPGDPDQQKAVAHRVAEGLGS